MREKIKDGTATPEEIAAFELRSAQARKAAQARWKKEAP